MSDHKKHLGKKRQKIFSIEKVYLKGTPKNLSKQKINLSPISHLFSTKEKISSPSFKFNSNLDESQEKLTPENQRHSLISISKLVYDFLKKNEYTTGNNVTENIKNVLQPKKNDQSNQKNIQRRVYDAINVMCAVGLIKKNKQEIQFLKKLNSEKNNNLNNIINLNENNTINIEIQEEKILSDDKIKEKLDELEEERKNLIKGYLTLKFYEKYTKLNDEYPQRKSQKKLEFPIDLIKYNNSFPIKITSKDDLTRYLIVSNSGFIHLKPYDTIKELMSSEILAKLNESNNLNDIHANHNKSNSKKSTNDESLLDDININNNINLNNSFNINEEQEEKKLDEDPKKIKILNDSFNNNDIKEIEEKTFNYLKNKKIFKDELSYNNANLYGIINNENEDEGKEEIENNIEKENENTFTEHRFRKNSNISYVSNLYDDNELRANKRDYNIPEMGLFNIN
jgi:hypothetical protein